MTYLHLAVQRGHMNSVKYLVNNGADINTKDNKGVCVWDYSSENRLFWKQELVSLEDGRWQKVLMFVPTEWGKNLGKDIWDPAEI